MALHSDVCVQPVGMEQALRRNNRAENSHSRCDGESARCNGSSRPDQRSASSLFMPPCGMNMAQILSASSSILPPAFIEELSGPTVTPALHPQAGWAATPAGHVLEDKIVQRSNVEVLNAICEEDFLGFSYGSVPGGAPQATYLPQSRAPHQATRTARRGYPPALPSNSRVRRDRPR